jgi:hypothetical protein
VSTDVASTTAGLREHKKQAARAAQSAAAMRLRGTTFKSTLSAAFDLVAL